MAFATLLAAALAIVGFGAWRLLAARRVAFGNWIGLVALAIWLVVVGAVQLVDRPQGRSELARSTDSLAWPGGTTESPLAGPRAAATPTGVQVASVESLIGGLETRLATQPNDAAGWALLAQSYAHTANEEAVERALRRAVELGADETALRARVDAAQRGAPPVDWVEHALRK
ncbi:MAG TPA: hypothetical protein VKA43_16300 [Gammaproteobacteria bacterium]|nr:hypothetical protein [Gammaproteobacteria bacterium]